MGLDIFIKGFEHGRTWIMVYILLKSLFGWRLVRLMMSPVCLEFLLEMGHFLDSLTTNLIWNGRFGRVEPSLPSSRVCVSVQAGRSYGHVQTHAWSL